MVCHEKGMVMAEGKKQQEEENKRFN